LIILHGGEVGRSLVSQVDAGGGLLLFVLDKENLCPLPVDLLLTGRDVGRLGSSQSFLHAFVSFRELLEVSLAFSKGRVGCHENLFVKVNLILNVQRILSGRKGNIRLSDGLDDSLGSTASLLMLP
jgi:hypothetical protein